MMCHANFWPSPKQCVNVRVRLNALPDLVTFGILKINV